MLDLYKNNTCIVQFWVDTSVKYPRDMENIPGHSTMKSAVLEKMQLYVNRNRAVSVMCLKLSVRNQSAPGSLKANQQFCRWTGWSDWLAAYSFCQRKNEEKSNSGSLQNYSDEIVRVFQNDSPSLKWHTCICKFKARSLSRAATYMRLLGAWWAILTFEKNMEGIIRNSYSWCERKW